MPPTRWILPLLILVALLAACGEVPTQTAAEPTATQPLVTVAYDHPTRWPTATGSPPTIGPSRTPRPTATLVYHVIEAGDTLLELAGRFQVSVDDILVANPGLRPEFLQIGQRIIVPTGDRAGAAGGPLPTPTPLPLRTSAVHLYPTPTGGIWALGEVLNSTSNSVEEVQVSVDLYNNAGALIATMKTWCIRDVIPPGESGPFGVLFSQPLSNVTSSMAQVVRAVPAIHSADHYATLIAVAHQGRPTGPTYTVTGTIRNQGEQPADQVQVVVTLYNSDSEVIGFRQVVLDGPLLPGSTVPFEVWVAPGAPGAETYGIAVGGRTAISSQQE